MNQSLKSIELTKQLCNQFFLENGYSGQKPEPLIPNIDRSVLYTNSAIIPFKQLIAKNKVVDHPQYLLQECIRLHETKFTPNEDYFLERMSCFSMFGVFSPIDFLEKSCLDMLTLLHDVLKVDSDRLVFHASSNDRNFWGVLEKMGVNILWDKTPEKEYQWRYGMEGVIGRGLNIGIAPKLLSAEMIRSVDDIDIGQIIVIKRGGYPVYFEIALGIEAYLWRQSGKESPFAVSEISAFMPFKFESLHMQLMDAIVLGVVFFGNNVDLYTGDGGRLPKGKNRLSTLKKAVKNIAEIEALINVNFDINKVIKDYSLYKGFSASGLSRLLEMLDLERMNFRQKEKRLFEYSATCVRAVQNKKLSYIDACNRIREKAHKKYALYPPTIRSALQAVKNQLGKL